MPEIEPAARGVAPSPGPYRAGSLTYSRNGLMGLFFWLLGADFIFTILDQIEPVVLPVLLKQNGANDREIALLVSSIPAVANLFVNPVVSYCSDRTRSRWGRRIPYLAVATPLVTLSLALTPFAPEIAHHALGRVIPTFALLIGLYQIFKYVIASVYFYLLRDVVPIELMGRFLAGLRIFGALGTFALEYWLLGLTGTHPRAIFIGVAVLNLIGFGALCLTVREGDYPEVVDRIQTRSGLARFGPIRAALNFTVESFNQPVYRWTYLSRLMVYATMPMTGFVVLFANNQLGLGLSATGKYMAWPSMAWLLVAYPVGKLMDRWGPIRVMQVGLVLGIGGYLASFFLVAGPKTFLAAWMVTYLDFWVLMLAQLMLAQVIFHPMRMGQLSAANALSQSVVIAAITGPASGFLVETARNTHLRLALPMVGHVDLTHYRFIYLLLAAVYAASLAGLFRVRRHWLKLGGPSHYQPPLWPNSDGAA